MPVDTLDKEMSRTQLGLASFSVGFQNHSKCVQIEEFDSFLSIREIAGSVGAPDSK